MSAGRYCGGALQPLGSPRAGVALDRAEGQVQTVGAFQQAGALAERVVDLLPASRGGLGAIPALRRASRAQHAECAATSLRATAARLCHRCQRSRALTAPGRAHAQRLEQPCPGSAR
jgi:hypothetical protein